MKNKVLKMHIKWDIKRAEKMSIKTVKEKEEEAKKKTARGAVMNAKREERVFQLVNVSNSY